MKEFIATFYTHADALIAHTKLSKMGLNANMMPVPRKLSSSCGTCVRYTAEDALIDLLKTCDAEGIYSVEGLGKYTEIYLGE